MAERAVYTLNKEINKAMQVDHYPSARTVQWPYFWRMHAFCVSTPLSCFPQNNAHIFKEMTNIGLKCFLFSDTCHEERNATCYISIDDVGMCLPRAVLALDSNTAFQATVKGRWKKVGERIIQKIQSISWVCLGPYWRLETLLLKRGLQSNRNEGEMWIFPCEIYCCNIPEQNCNHQNYR